MPRYPFSPAVLDALPEELAELYRGLELTLLKEICGRLKASGQLNEVTVQDIRALRAMGIDLTDIQEAIADATGVGEAKLAELFDDVVERNQVYYSQLIDLTGVTAPERLIDERDIAAIRRQTWGAYKNITGSMGFLAVQGGRLTFLPPAKAYEWALDSAALQIQSGAISYNQAIASAVKQLAESGLKTVSYESGHIDSVDVAVRRAVMTGVNQLNQKYREQSMDYLGTDLVEVTAHLGARNKDGPMGWENHAAWQGKVYRWRRDGKSPSLERRTEPNPPQLVQTERPAAIEPKSTPPGRTALDVTQEYLDSAAPWHGTVTYEPGYRTKGHQDEIKMAEWMLRTFGGEIKLLKEADQDSIKRADYLWNKALWELKGASSINGADKLLQHAIKQIQDNPGGVILNILNDIDLPALERQLARRFYRSNLDNLDLMLLSKGNLVKVLRYKK